MQAPWSPQQGQYPTVAPDTNASHAAGFALQRSKTWLRRSLAVLLGAAVSSGVCGLSTVPTAAARSSGGGVAGAVPRKANPALESESDLFMHYSLMGDVRLAHDYGQALLNKKPSPVALLRAFEAARNGRNITRLLLRDQRVPQLKVVAVKLFQMLQQGHIALIRNPDRIKAELKRMTTGPQGYVIARQRLRAAGQYAVPYLIAALNNPRENRMQTYVLRMIQDVGRPELNPLLEELHTRNPAEKTQLVEAIGEIGYPQALPYLKQIMDSKKSSPDLKQAARLAFVRCDPSGQFAKYSAAHLFLNLAYGYFHKTSGLTASYRKEATNPVWFYDRGLNNVVGVPVPTPIWSDIEAMRACERALQLQHNYRQAISLWLAADFRREIDLPPGKKDPTHKPTAPNANYYAVAAGPVYLNPALSMSLSMRNAPLSLQIIRALQETAGSKGLVGSGASGGTPLLQALAYPDRAVRFAAAFALARANPKKKFKESFRVVPVLSDALSETGKPVALLVVTNANQRNKMMLALKKKFHVYAAPTIAQALAQAGHASAINLVIVPGGTQANDLIIAAETDYRLQATPVLVTGPAYEMARLHLQYLSQRTFATLLNNAPIPAVMKAYSRLRREIGNTPVNNAKAMRWALASAQLLKQIAENRGSIYNANDALPALVRLLQSKQSELVIASGAVLGHLDNPKAQIALAKSALTTRNHSNKEQRKLYVDLADSAKQIGNHLSSKDIHKIVKVVQKVRNPKLRNAVAQALGALNIRSNQASKLIRIQTQI